MSRETAKAKVLELVTKFVANSATYTSSASGYNETQARTDFITPFLEAFGWNVRNGANLPEDQRDVIEEATVEVGEEKLNKKPDYELRVARQRKLFVEAKKPATHIGTDKDAVFQTRRYGFSASMPIAVLTNFAHLAIYDCIPTPSNADDAVICRLKFIPFSEYEARFDEIYDLLSREYVHSGAFDKRFKVKPEYRGTNQFDELFLKQIRSWRLRLAEDIVANNDKITGSFLTFASQRFLTRLVFLRICEDRDIEKYETLRKLTGKGAYEALKAHLKTADQTYNSGLFKSVEDQSLGLTISDEVLGEIITELYYPKSAYTFAVIEPGILGEIYELLLGEALEIRPKKKVEVVLKPEVKASGGVCATPQYIVEDIVKKTIRAQIDGKPLAKLTTYTTADIACGSGIFLLVAYQAFLDCYRDWYIKDGAAKHLGPRLFEAGMGRLELTLEERRKILTQHIYGVDIDEQAVEVARFSLLLKLIERETADSIKAYVVSHKLPSLPSLNDNIQHGNSLVTSKTLKDVYPKTAAALVPKVVPFDWEDAFPFIKNRGGFSSIVGNPPYIRIQNMVSYSPEEVEIYRDNKFGYSTANTDNFDKYELFTERAVNLLEPGGVLGFIIPNKFFTIKSGANLRKFLAKGHHVSEIVHFGAQQVFGSKASNYTCIIIGLKSPSANVSVERVTNLGLWRYGHHGEMSTFKSAELGELPWRFASDEVNKVFELMRANNPTKLGSAAEIFVGAQTSADKIYVIDPTSESKTHVTFTDVAGDERRIERAILYPFLHDAQIIPFGTPKANKYIIWPYRKVNGKMAVLSESELQANYPLAWDYLRSFAAKLKQRSILGGSPKDRKWYQFGRAQSLDKFDSEKIIATVLSREPKYGYENQNVIVSGGGNGPYYAIRPRPGASHSIFFILAILCHPLSEAIIRTKTSVFEGGYYSHGKQFLEELPVPNINFASLEGVKEHAAVVEEVKKLIVLTDSTKIAMTPATYAVAAKQIEMTRDKVEARLNKIYGLTQAGLDVIRSVPVPE
jgi:type I restriction-modification system DNA methylase subunit